MECAWQVEIDPYRLAVLARHWAEARPTELADAYRPIATLAYLVGETSPHGGNELELIAVGQTAAALRKEMTT